MEDRTDVEGLSTASLLARLLLSAGLAVALLFIPAGRLDWLQGWLLLVFFFGAVLALYLWLRRTDPALAAERQQAGENVEPWDRAIMAVYTLLLLVLVVVAGLDSGRFGWSAVPLWLQLLGWLGLTVAMATVWWAMASNTYLSELVRIQEDRGHQVVTAGPYHYVRHPMYVGVILAVASVPLVLASLWALLPAGLIAALFVIRTGLEDRTLQEKLPGYQDYTAQVRYRLIPGVW
jgi:protein-S-isoprenylcysteine O-methyltransferase Ste14